MGNVSEDALYTLAAYKLIESIKKSRKYSQSEKTKLINQIQTATATATQTATATKTATATQTATATKTATQVQTAEAVKTGVTEATQTSDMTRVGDAVKTTSIDVATASSIRPIRLDASADKTSQRPTPAQMRNATAWAQGFGWWIKYQDKSGQSHLYFHKGERPPKGIQTVQPGSGEAYRSIQQHRGTSPLAFDMQMGAVNVSVDRPERKPGRSGAIAFTPSVEPITNRRTRLTGRRPRITPRRPRIKR